MGDSYKLNQQFNLPQQQSRYGDATLQAKQRVTETKAAADVNVAVAAQSADAVAEAARVKAAENVIASQARAAEELAIAKSRAIQSVAAANAEAADQVAAAKIEDARGRGQQHFQQEVGSLRQQPEAQFTQQSSTLVAAQELQQPSPQLFAAPHPPPPISGPPLAYSPNQSHQAVESAVDVQATEHRANQVKAAAKEKIAAAEQLAEAKIRAAKRMAQEEVATAKAKAAQEVAAAKAEVAEAKARVAETKIAAATKRF